MLRINTQDILPSPSALSGLDAYSEWRPGQDRVFSDILDWLYTTSPVLGVPAPTGSGKSLLSALSARITGKQTVILTSTTGLQTQYMGDYEKHGMKDVRGRRHYLCNQTAHLRVEHQSTVEDADCHTGYICPIKGDGCSYYDAVRAARESSVIVTNYAFWLAAQQYMEAWEPDLLILDEAHSAFKAMESFLAFTVDMTGRDATYASLPSCDGIDDWHRWKSWAYDAKNAVIPRAMELSEQLKGKGAGDHPGGHARLKRLHELTRNLALLINAQHPWAWERKDDEIGFTPIWPQQYAAAMLYKDVPKIMVMSAVLTAKTMEQIGLGGHKLLEVPSFFPASNTPVSHVRNVRVGHKMSYDDQLQWVRQIDNLIERRLDRKTILFTVSYARRDFFLRNTRLSSIMVSHDPSDVVAKVAYFKQLSAPRVFVSPAVTTGWNFPDADCSYIIVGKIPYPDTRPQVNKARAIEDKTWSAAAAMETLVQETSRGTRSPDDRCEVSIVDDNWNWFWAANKQFAPPWFHDRVYAGRRRGEKGFLPPPLAL